MTPANDPLKKLRALQRNQSFESMRDAIAADLSAVVASYVGSDSTQESCAAAEVAMEWVAAYLLVHTRRCRTSAEAAGAVAGFNCGVAAKLSCLMVQQGLRR
jgi:hypothetical protein